MAGYQLYLQHTVPQIMLMARTDPNVQYGGETVPLARFKMQKGAQIAAVLADTYKQLKRPADQARAEQAEQEFLRVAGPQQQPS